MCATGGGGASGGRAVPDDGSTVTRPRGVVNDPDCVRVGVADEDGEHASVEGRPAGDRKGIFHRATGEFMAEGDMLGRHREQAALLGRSESRKPSGNQGVHQSAVQSRRHDT